MSMNEAVEWVKQVAHHTKPESIHWCDGSDLEARALAAEMVKAGSLVPLDADLFPRSFLHRSHPESGGPIGVFWRIQFSAGSPPAFWRMPRPLGLRR